MFKDILIVIAGLSASMLVAAGVFAYFIMIGVVTRMTIRTRTAGKVRMYEDMVVLGGLTGNLLSIYQFELAMGSMTLAIYGLSAGVFIGCLAIALAEIINAFPILIKRLKLKVGLRLIIIFFGLGKGIGALLQLLLFK